MPASRRHLPRIAAAFGSLSLVAAIAACGDAGPSETTAGSSPEALDIFGDAGFPDSSPIHWIDASYPPISSAETPPTSIAGCSVTNIPVPQKLSGLGCTSGIGNDWFAVWACPSTVTVPSNLGYAHGTGLPTCAESANGPVSPPLFSPPCEAVGWCAGNCQISCVGQPDPGWQFVVDVEVTANGGIGTSCGGGCGSTHWPPP
jgi:hypothetical protein